MYHCFKRRVTFYVIFILWHKYTECFKLIARWGFMLKDLYNLPQAKILCTTGSDTILIISTPRQQIIRLIFILSPRLTYENFIA